MTRPEGWLPPLSTLLVLLIGSTALGKLTWSIVSNRCGRTRTTRGRHLSRAGWKGNGGWVGGVQAVELGGAGPGADSGSVQGCERDAKVVTGRDDRRGGYREGRAAEGTRRAGGRWRGYVLPLAYGTSEKRKLEGKEQPRASDSRRNRGGRREETYETDSPK